MCLRIMFILFTTGFHVAQGPAQVRSTVYVAVVRTNLFVVGAANPLTGIFLQHPGDDTTWQHIGARTIRAFGVAVPPADSGRSVYMAAGNGVHKTSDAGKTWKITTGWRITEVLWVSVDPFDRKVVYCATPYGVFKSTDGGSTWQEKNRGLTALFVPCVVADIATPNNLYCVTEEGLFLSSDGAESWVRSSLSVPNTRVIAQNPRLPSMLIAGTENNGIYVSRDGGKTWSRSEAGVDHLTFYTFAFDPANENIVYAGGYITGVYKSIDGARSWRRVDEGLSNQTIHCIAVDPAKSDRVYAGSVRDGIFRSENGGATWQRGGLSGSQVWQITFQPF